jgi:hypothetical protein
VFTALRYAKYVKSKNAKCSNNVETMFIQHYLEKAASKDWTRKREDGTDAAANNNHVERQHWVSHERLRARMSGDDAATNNER